MFNTAILDLVIGLAFIYLFLGLMCSVIQEWISRFLSLRSKTLNEGIRELLYDDTLQELANDVYAHPLIAQLTRKGTGKHQQKIQKKMESAAVLKENAFSNSTLPGNQKSNYPSYIPSETFARVILEVILPEGAQQPKTVSELQSIVVALPNGQIKTTLLNFINYSGDDLINVKKQIEDWYDGMMDRVSGWYKRHTQTLLLLIAFSISVIFNANTLTMAKTLWMDKELRNAIVLSASSLNSADNVSLCKQDPLECHTFMKKELAKLSLPLGWEANTFMDVKQIEINTLSITKFFFWLSGILITTFSVSLGAPFWFDSLTKLVNLRSTGIRPPKSNKQ